MPHIIATSIEPVVSNIFCGGHPFECENKFLHPPKKCVQIFSVQSYDQNKKLRTKKNLMNSNIKMKFRVLKKSRLFKIYSNTIFNVNCLAFQCFPAPQVGNH